MYIIRSQGFFYTDEYFAPIGELVQVVRQTFATKAQAEEARARLVRKWVRSSPIDDFVSMCAEEGECDYDAARAYMAEQWPDYDPTEREPLPSDATDQQIDELVKRSRVRFAEVFEVSEPDTASGDGNEDGYEGGEEGGSDELYYGPDRIPPAPRAVAQPARTAKKTRGAVKVKAAPSRASKRARKKAR